MNYASNRADSQLALRDVGPNNFDAVRFFAAVMVIFSHCFPLLFWEGNGLDPLEKLTANEFSFGDVAVDVFFAVSGFLIVMSWERSSSPFPSSFGNELPIVPGYVSATLIGFFAFTPIFMTHGQSWFSLPIAAQCARAMLHLKAFEVGGVFPLNPYVGVVNGSVDIRYKFKCYLGVLFFGLIGAARRRWMAIIVFLGLLVLCALHLHAQPHDFVARYWSAIRLDSISLRELSFISTVTGFK